MMLKEMIDRLAELGKETSRLQVLKDTGQQIVFVNAEGEIDVWESDIYPSRNHTALTVESFIGLAELRGGITTTVWVAPDEVTAVLYDQVESFRDDVIKLPLRQSPLFELLKGMTDSRFNQKQLVNLLKTGFTSATIEPASFNTCVRNIKWTTQGEVTGTHTRTSDGMGASIRKEAHGLDQLPDLINIHFNAYPGICKDEPIEVSVQCAVIIHTDEEKLQVSPLPGQLAEALSNALEQVRDRLIYGLPEEQGLNERVFAGRP
jgi:hypothetical protein